MGFKISLAGDLGSGKSTVANILISQLGAEYYGTGIIARRIAADMGIDIAELNIYSETHPEIDELIDNGLRALSSDPRNLIIDSRMAWHFVCHTFRVYLTTDPTVAALRIKNAGRGAEESFKTLEEATARIRARKESEKRRYFDLYGVNCKDLDNYDLVIDTTFATPEQVADRLRDELTKWMLDSRHHSCFLCPRRLHYPDDAPDMEAVGELSNALERGEEIPPVRVVYENEEFYVVEGDSSALAYALLDLPFVPCTPVKEPLGGRHFVRMEDSL